MPVKSLPSAVYSIVPKHGENDCAVACLATILRREYGEVLAAASRSVRTVWTDGLTMKEMLRVARTLKGCVMLVQTFDPEEDSGVLSVSFRDRAVEHAVVLIEGWIFDPEHNPVSMWRYEDYLAVQNAVPSGLIKEVPK